MKNLIARLQARWIDLDFAFAFFAASALILAVAIATSGCATSFIDKVSQTRVATAGISYRTVAEFNAYYQGQTNALHGTTPDLEAKRSLIYEQAVNLGVSLAALEALEDSYRAAPTNQPALLNALGAVAENATNLVNTVNYLQGTP